MATCFDEDWEPFGDSQTDYQLEEEFGMSVPPTLDVDHATSTFGDGRSCMQDPLSDLLGSDGEVDERRQQYLEGVYSMAGRVPASTVSSFTLPVNHSAPSQVMHVIS